MPYSAQVASKMVTSAAITTHSEPEIGAPGTILSLRDRLMVNLAPGLRSMALIQSRSGPQEQPFQNVCMSKIPFDVVLKRCYNDPDDKPELILILGTLPAG